MEEINYEEDAALVNRITDACKELEASIRNALEHGLTVDIRIGDPGVGKVRVTSIKRILMHEGYPAKSMFQKVKNRVKSFR